MSRAGYWVHGNDATQFTSVFVSITTDGEGGRAQWDFILRLAGREVGDKMSATTNTASAPIMLTGHKEGHTHTVQREGGEGGHREGMWKR